MSRSENRWADETAWWTMGAAEARRRMHPACVMILPRGILQGRDILSALDGPRWEGVTLGERRFVETEDCICLLYTSPSPRD